MTKCVSRRELDAWMAPFKATQKKPDAWPKQVTLHELLHEGELHRCAREAHVLVGWVPKREDVHLVTTSTFLESTPRSR